MKQIDFKQKTSQNIYKEYLKRIEKATKQLSKSDRNEVLMEFNSHIYEGMKNANKTNEFDSLLIVLEKLGAPEEVLKPLVADKKMEQATRTFNPIHIFQALILNIANGISYIIFGILYFFLFIGLLLVFIKIFLPAKTGLFYKENEYLIFGFTDNSNAIEILGNWFIPVVLASVTVLYFSITLLLRLKRKNKKD